MAQPGYGGSLESCWGFGPAGVQIPPFALRYYMARPGLDEYFMRIAELVATRSTCTRNNVGAIIVKGKQIVSTGYNGPPAGTPHCDVTGCLREDLNIPSGQRHELCRGAHAEQNAIAQAAKHGIAINGATLYCTHQPCSICTKIIINAGIKKVIFQKAYPDPLALQLTKESGLELYVYNPETKQRTPWKFKESYAEDIARMAKG